MSLLRKNISKRGFLNINSFLGLLILFNLGCGNNSSLETSQKNNSSSLPFIGQKYFETRHGVSGTGTPRFMVEIKKNRDVIFTFEQINQNDKSVVTDSFYAGKYKKYLYCSFELDDFPRYFHIAKDFIYEVDSVNFKLSLVECCGLTDTNSVCPCEGDMYSFL